jgi:Histidine kinase
MANSNRPDPGTRVWPIVKAAIAEGSPAVKRLVRWVAFFSALMVALQIWDSRDGRGVSGVAELMSVLLGICGIALLGIAHTLQLSMAEAAERPERADETGVARVLLALPSIGFLAGVALGGAALLMIIRGALGTELPLAVAGTALYSALAVVAARTVTHSAQTLFRAGASHAQRAADYRTAATAARLDALQARMNPHVLFNALNNVASLIRSNPPAAERVVETLGDVLKQTLDRSGDVDGTVADEIAYVRNCLALEHERWGDHLRVSWAVNDEVLDWPLPPFVIQPLVENSLRHGLGSRIDGGHIRIAVTRDGEALSASVEDDGSGFPQHWREGNGLGNLRQRLHALFGSDAALIVESPGPGRSRVMVRVPRRRAHPPRPSGITHASADRRR